MSEQERPDRLRLGRMAPTSSARRKKQALHPPEGRGRGRGRVGPTSLATVDAAGGIDVTDGCIPDYGPATVSASVS